MNFCEDCGRGIPADKIFCDFCQSKVVVGK